MAVNKKEMVKSLIQAYFNVATKYWEESDKIPVAAKESITYEEDTEELIDYLLASVGYAWNTKAFLNEDFTEGPEYSLCVKFYKELKNREVDWNEVWDRLIQLVEFQAELGELEEV